MKKVLIIVALVLLTGCANLKFQASASYMNDAAATEAEEIKRRGGG